MKQISGGHFYGDLANQRKPFPLNAQIELTYRCNFNCIHCYCQGCGDFKCELSTREWKDIVDIIQKEGCIYVTLTGGEPLIREDFWELYEYIYKKGFIITLFTNGYNLGTEAFKYLTKFPPYSIEITLNGITKNTFEKVTLKKGSFEKVFANIKKIKKNRLPLILKSIYLKQNLREIPKIKAFAEELLEKTEGKICFRNDFFVYPRLDGKKMLYNCRLSASQVSRLKKTNQRERKENNTKYPSSPRSNEFLYHCSSWRKQFTIDPYGMLKFCGSSNKFSVDLKNTSFREGFYKVFPQVLEQKFKTNSKCKKCSLRGECFYCPAKALLETGQEESPVEYYCQLARAQNKAS